MDATKESGRLGRLINHSTKRNNAITKTVEVNGTPHLYLMASRDIRVGEEVLFDYGERRKNVLDALSWLRE